MQRAEIGLFSHVKIADITKKNYLLSIEQFKESSGLKDLRRVKPKVLKEKLVEYVIYLKQKKQCDTDNC